MKVGLFVPLSNPFATPDFITALGEESEARGFHSLWVAEHVVLFDQYESQYPYAADGKIPAGGESGMLDPFPTLAYLAAATKTVRLGTGICLVPQRNPVYTAKEVATVDWLSNGRLDFGVGVGWLAEEFQACDVPFERRGERTRDYLAAMRRLWEDPVSEYHGEFYDFPPLRMYPKPVQQPHPPIHFGGETTAALKRVADIGQGWYGFNRLPEDVPEARTRLEKLLAENGRSIEDVEISICPYLKGRVDADMVKRYEDVGVDQVIALAFAVDVDGLRQVLDGLAPLVTAS